MRKLILSFTVALLLAGCASEQEDAAVSSSNSPSAVQVAPAWAPIRSADRAAFVSLPDRGTLLAYDRDRATVNRGAETYHPIRLSEAHALNATAPGRSLALQTPSGENLRFAYRRMEEGLDGNWSWIGRTPDGLEAIITFGEEAVFGRIEQRGTQALQITMSAGQPWLVQADPNRMFDGNLLRGRDRTDVLIPSDLAVSAAARKRTATAGASPVGAKIGEVGSKASAANTVDVVLGYTNGLVARIGSVSATNTRLTNLIAITNQAYQNSLITPRVRLVRTVQVNYTDTNDNEVALEALTGVSCSTSGCSNQTVPAELQPLRTARDQYGGDLVSLVRQHKAPEQNGCGIAWLLGGGGFAIDNTDAPFGYSVVGDGTDVSEADGRSYFCYDVTLAHELGHNMGQQHNVEDSGGDSGTHPYSYGYRESSTTGFFTVMAYEIDNASQFSITHFGNPNVNYASTNRATGTANANNAASLNLSMPLVVQFRNLVVPLAGGVRNDVDGDGRSDLIWHQPQQGLLNVWLMNGTTISGSFAKAISPLCTPRAVGDLNGDGRADVIWICSDSGVYLWQSTGNNFTQLFIGGFTPGWDLVAARDANADGRDDLIWHQPQQGLLNTWLMNGTTISGSFAKAISPLCSPKGYGDLNGDGRSDVTWICSDSGVYLWQSTGSSYDQLFISGFSPGWTIVTAKDANGDGRDDLIWHNADNGLLNTWLMNGTTISGSFAKALSTLCSPGGYGDHNGDGRSDVSWVCSDSGVYQWRSTGSNYDQLFVGGFTPGWSLLKN